MIESFNSLDIIDQSDFTSLVGKYSPINRIENFFNRTNRIISNRIFSNSFQFFLLIAKKKNNFFKIKHGKFLWQEIQGNPNQDVLIQMAITLKICIPIKFTTGWPRPFFPKEMLISLSILKLHKNPWIWKVLRTIHFI